MKEPRFPGHPDDWTDEQWEKHFLWEQKNNPCTRPYRGWKCNLGANHYGPCPMYPRWWNLRGVLWHLSKGRINL